MKIVCIQCGGEFSISAEDLGGTGFCPHCKASVTLPKASPNQTAATAERPTPSSWLENSLSGLASLVLHLVVFVVIALLQADGGTEGIGEGEEIQIGLLPVADLNNSPEEQLSSEEVPEIDRAQSTEVMELIEIEAPGTSAEAASGELAALGVPSPTAGDTGSFEMAGPASAGSMGGGSWEGMIGNLRRNGLDIVLCFDSTGSMAGEIGQVKQQIERIGSTLTTLVPKARIGICTYRDVGDEYVTRGLPLSSSIQDVSTFLDRIQAGGGGDHPEAVDEGLYWSTEHNPFRPAARKVILVFGDAPPHREKLQRCLDLASGFRGQSKGIVSTVTCRHERPLEEFYEIAMAGGGEAFLARDQRQIMTQLMVLVFGSKHRQKVIEAFKLLEE
ncbi:MAG: VWA domain-containing protein [Pirellulaceae bacterium]|nr:VWA domain-containing protein [Pirellulaceae bacterium]